MFDINVINTLINSAIKNAVNEGVSEYFNHYRERIEDLESNHEVLVERLAALERGLRIANENNGKLLKELHPAKAAELCAAARQEMLEAGNDKWLEEARCQERETCKRIAKEHAAMYEEKGHYFALLGRESALIAASACNHIAHLIDQRSRK
jgi:hypothetical protein